MPGNTEGKKLGIWMSTSLVVGNIIGAGIFMIPAALAVYGSSSILGWLISAIGALFLAKVFSKLSTLIRGKDGGPYAYTQVVFGDFMGFLIAWGYWVSIWAGNASLAIAFVSALSVVFPLLGESAILAVSLGLAAIWFLTWINTRAIRSSGAMQVATTLLKIVPLLLVIFGGMFYFDSANLADFNPSGESPLAAIAITTTLTLSAFLGIESATIPAGNIKNPDTTIPRATMIGTWFTIVLYILSTVVIMGMIPMHELANSPSPFADAMGLMTGDWGRNLVAIGAAISAFGALNGWTLLDGQIPKATAEDNLFPPIFKKLNKNGAPALGIVIGSVLTSVVMLMNYSDGLAAQFRFLILLTTFCMLVPYLLTAAAYLSVMLHRKLPSHAFWPIILLGGGAFLFSLWGLYGSGEASVFYGFLLLMAGIPFYVWIQWKNQND